MSKIITAVLVLICIGAPWASADDWLFYRGPNQDGSSTETSWNPKFGASGPKIVWRKKVGIGAASVVVKGDRVITMGNAGNMDVVTCLNADTGKVMWTHKYRSAFDKRMHDGGAASTPTIDGDLVYTLGEKGELFCLSLTTGEPKWAKHLVKDFSGKLSRWHYAGSPLVEGNFVYVDVGGKQYSTIALNKNNGAPFWGAGNDNAGYATPIVMEQNGKRALLVFKGKALVANDLKSGRQLWRIPWSTSHDVSASTPLIMGDKMFLSSGYSTGGALFDLKSSPPRRLWKNSDIKTKISTCVAYEGNIYGANQKGSLLCIDGKTGRTLWSERGMGSGSLSIADGKLIVISGRGDLAIAEANPKEFKAISRAKVLSGTCWVMPVLANGRIYVKNNKGELICIDVRG